MPSSPTVSCLMVTADRPALARRAILSFREQTYPRKELVVLDNGERQMDDLLADLPDAEVRYRHVRKAPGTWIGALRNESLGMATGGLVVPQWDDDDWSHPERLARQAAVLLEGYAACTLPGYLVHLDSPDYFEHPFVGRLREGTCLMHRRGDAIRYPNTERKSDTAYVRAWRERRHRQLAPADARLYVRTFHGGNLWDETHILRRMRNTPADLLAYGWHRYVRRDVLGHPRFRLGPAARASFELYLRHSRACGLFAKGVPTG